MTPPSSNPSTFTLRDGTPITLRLMVEADLQGLEWEGEYSHFRQLYREHYESACSGNMLIWVAVSPTGKIVGQVFLLLMARQPEVADGIHRAYLFSFRIRPEHRNQGLGSFMLSFVDVELKKRGFTSIRLNVARANSQARKLYERHGYHLIGPDPGVWRYIDNNGQWQTVREPAWKMQKKLD
ncbi:MAG TPA: GNAT family N-acetyltransferase [Anaerolineaceae bacterium]|nr:GNAT family N-acetyltransferase [Anaerolineaceae bacterium]